MIKGLKIVGFLTLLLAFGACEKCDKPVSITEDPFLNASDRSAVQIEKEGYYSSGRSNLSTGNIGDITDPNEDKDFDGAGIVDPDEDEDFDQDGK